MGTSNINYLFYKDYYKDENNNFTVTIVENHIIDKNKNLCEQKIFNIAQETIDHKLENSTEYPGLLRSIAHTFKAETTYPGLLIGMGYEHGTGFFDNEFKSGLHFDYTSGMPLIPGSSIKGVLRSAFPEKRKDDKDVSFKENLNNEINERDIEKLDYIKESLNNICNRIFSADEIFSLKDEIFEGVKNQKQLSIYERDIFYDAFISGGNEPFLGDDYITPHLEEFGNPTPIKIIKILPKTKFDFYFSLKDGIISGEEKLKLFKNIILDLGLGAKTNSGYGVFDRKLCEADFIRVAEERRKNNEKQKEIEKEKALKEYLESLSPQEREKVRINSIKNEPEKMSEIIKIYNKLKEYSGEEVILWATLIKELFISTNNWGKKKPSPKQEEKIKKIKEILGE